MAVRKKLTGLRALKLLQNIQGDDSDAEGDIESNTDIYNLLEDNHDSSESESLSDYE